MSLLILIVLSLMSDGCFKIHTHKAQTQAYERAMCSVIYSITNESDGL